MITAWNAHRDYLHLSASAHPGDEQPPQSWKMIYWQASSVNCQLLTVSRDWKRILFLTEQSGNVIENKGPLWKTWGRSWNVYEKKVLSPIKRESY
jgi:hypothetical protein